MYSNLISYFGDDSVWDLFNLLEDPVFQVVEVYLKENGWDSERARLVESKYTGVGTYRILLNLAFSHLDFSMKDLILFYEKSRRPKDEPHYEDLITTLLIGIATGVLATSLSDSLKMGISGLKATKKQKKTAEGELEKELAYLFRGRWLRDFMWEKEISKEDHDRFLEYFRKKYLDEVEKTAPPIDDAGLVLLEEKFHQTAQIHNLKLDSLMDSIQKKFLDLSVKMIEFNTLIEGFKNLLKAKEESQGD